MGGAYALNLSFFRSAAHDFDIETDNEFYEKLRVIENEVLEILDKQSKDKICDAGQKARCTAEFGEDYLAWACRQCKDMGAKTEFTEEEEGC